MSVFQRIDPDHPLAQAARETNDYAAEHGLEETLAWLGMEATTDDLAYLGEQRALRAIAAASVGISLGENASVDESVVRAIMETPLWRDMRMLLVGCYMDAFAIGWRAHEIASSDGAFPRELVRVVEVDGLPGAGHYAELGSQTTLCGITEGVCEPAYPPPSEVSLCAVCKAAFMARASEESK